jgi:hypothetical protein
MGNTSKGFRILLVTILVVSSLSIAFAQTIPNPQVPEFTLNVVHNPPYDIAPTTTVDPYTGETRITEPGHYAVKNTTVEISIKNQLFTPYADENGNIINLYYKVSFKGHFEDWDIYNSGDIVNASNSEYTVTQIPFNTFKDVQVDIRVLAQIGYYTRSMREGLASFPVPTYDYHFTGESSQWSTIQTITVPSEYNSSTTATPVTATSILPSQYPTSTPQPPVGSGSIFSLTAEQTTIAVMAVVIAVLAVAVIVLFLKIRLRNSPNQLLT